MDSNYRSPAVGNLFSATIDLRSNELLLVRRERITQCRLLEKILELLVAESYDILDKESVFAKVFPAPADADWDPAYGGYTFSIELGESHFAVHTTPERNRLVIAFQTCRGPTAARLVYQPLKDFLDFHTGIKSVEFYLDVPQPM